jgi:peptidoglycan lytic transglycosylase D
MPLTRYVRPAWGRIRRSVGSLMLVTTLLVSAGCARTREVHQFEPQPIGKVGQQDLQPGDTRSTTELLRAAEEAFREGNKAQEAGDQDTALKYYTAMLELLIEADLDPAVYYGLRSDFKRILETGTEHARLFEEGVSSDGGFGLLAGDLPIPFPVPEPVLREIERIQNDYPRGFAEGLNRSYAYAPYLREEFAKAGLPRDLIWLAMVESLFKPYAKSRASACGMWQFMGGTARRYGLRMDSYVDERYNWQRETQAAIAYLKELHTIFEGDWALAITAYNMGEGGVERAIMEVGGSRDIWRLVEKSRRMQPETKQFYAKLLATIIVARSPEHYGFNPEPQTPVGIVRVPVRGTYSLSRLAGAAGVSTSALKDLNPDLIAGVTPPSGTCMLAVPASGGERLVASLESLQEDTRKPVYAASDGFHLVRRGETLSHIATRYHVSLRELRRLNNIKSDKSLQVGQKIAVPGLASSTTTASAGATYRVRRGDNLYDIAKAHRVSLANLRAWNDLGTRSQIHPGQTLRVGPTATANKPAGTKSTHVVKSGEAPSTIAQRHGVKTTDLLSWNGLSAKSKIRPGQKLVIYGSAAAGTPASAPAASEKRVHKVSSGENPWTIAKKYGVPLEDFLAWNGLSRTSVLKPGQDCIVHASASTGTDAANIQKKTHTVRKGECAGTIAMRYGVKTSDFLKWNNLTAKSKLKIGKTYVVYVPAT